MERITEREKNYNEAIKEITGNDVVDKVKFEKMKDSRLTIVPSVFRTKGMITEGMALSDSQEQIKKLFNIKTWGELREIELKAYSASYSSNEPNYEAVLLNGLKKLYTFAGTPSSDLYAKILTIVLYTILGKGFSKENRGSLQKVYDVDVGAFLGAITEGDIKGKPEAVTPNRFGQAWIYFSGMPRFAEGKKFAVFGRKGLRAFPNLLEGLQNNTGLVRHFYLDANIRGKPMDFEAKRMMIGLVLSSLATTIKQVGSKKKIDSDKDFYVSLTNKVSASGVDMTLDSLYEALNAKDLETAKRWVKKYEDLL
jgi:hypothetical protein